MAAFYQKPVGTFYKFNKKIYQIKPYGGIQTEEWVFQLLDDLLGSLCPAERRQSCRCAEGELPGSTAAVAAHNARMLGSGTGFSGSKCLLSLTLLSKKSMLHCNSLPWQWVRSTFMDIASSIAPSFQGHKMLIHIIRMFSGVNIFLVFTELYLHKSQYKGLYSMCSHSNKILENTIAFWRLCKFREGFYFLFLRRLLINSASLYFSLIPFDAEEQHTD